MHLNELLKIDNTETCARLGPEIVHDKSTNYTGMTTVHMSAHISAHSSTPSMDP